MAFNDLKFSQKPRHSRAAKYGRCCHVSREARFLSDNGASSAPCLPSMRRAIPRQLQGQGLHLSRPLPLHGVCSTHLPGKPAGYRSLSASAEEQALPHGNPQLHFPQRHRQCQQDQGLADLRRLRILSDPDSPKALCRRQPRSRSRQHRLRFGCHNDQSVSFNVSLGRVQNDKGCGETAYPARSAWQHPELHLHFRWQAPRGQHPRPRPAGARGILRHGSGIPRLHSGCTLSTISGPSLSFVQSRT